MSNLVEHAKRELSIAGIHENSKDEMDRAMYKCIIDVIELFAKQGHSGFSAQYARGIVTALMAFEPLSPLTGKEDEWIDVSKIMDRPLWQNTRYGQVFKEADGKCFDVEGKIFYTKNDMSDTYTNGESWVEVTFPYTPKREYVQVEAEADSDSIKA